MKNRSRSIINYGRWKMRINKSAIFKPFAASECLTWHINIAFNFPQGNEVAFWAEMAILKPADVLADKFCLCMLWEVLLKQFG